MDLCFDNPAALLKSLDARPPMDILMRAEAADDQQALATLAQDGDIQALARGRSAVRLLWEVCQIPDFRKTLSDAHARLLGQIYRHLRTPLHRLPTDWTARAVARLDRTEGDIDTLVARIAHIRTWTYIANRADWLADPGEWRERTRALEDKLSDALHERLTQRFIDRRAAVLVRRRGEGGELLASIDASGAVLVEGWPAGQLNGFRFVVDDEAVGADGRALLSAARRALTSEIERRVQRLEGAPDADIVLLPMGLLTWQGAPVARLAAGANALAPEVRSLTDDLLDSGQAARVRARLVRWTSATIAATLAPLPSLRMAPLNGPSRGVAFQLVENLGTLPRASVASLLSGAACRELERLGVVCGQRHVYLPALLKPHTMALRGLLYAVHQDLPLPATVPPPGRVSLTLPPAGTGTPAFFRSIGYCVLGPLLVRVDMAERLLAAVARLARTGPFAPTSALSQSIACKPSELAPVLLALGCKREPGEPMRFRWRPEARRAGAKVARTGSQIQVSQDHPFARLRALGAPP